MQHHVNSDAKTGWFDAPPQDVMYEDQVRGMPYTTNLPGDEAIKRSLEYDRIQSGLSRHPGPTLAILLLGSVESDSVESGIPLYVVPEGMVHIVTITAGKAV
ncbi:MAG: hypothetical protein MRK00_08220 [Nitrosomonas sp.]|nr:hypothetical protein [Nitrosomonas sp.]